MTHPIPQGSVTRRPFGGWRRSATLASCALALSSCGGGTELLVVPLFLFGFTDAANNVSMSFEPERPATSTGSASVNVNVNDGRPSVVGTGAYNGCALSVTVPGNPAAPIASAYSGGFVSANVLQLTPNPAQAGRPVLNLSRNDVPGVPISPPNCP